MAFWGKKKRTADEQHAWLVATAQRVLAEQGIETTVAAPDAEFGVRLLATDGQTFLLHNALSQLEGASDRDAEDFLRRHLASVSRSFEAPLAGELPLDELRTRIRSRLMSVAAGPGGAPTTAYERPWAEGVAEVLCIDNPESVTIVSDRQLEDVDVPLDDLYAWGRVNTFAEPVDGPVEIAGGVFVVEGESLFTASRAVVARAMFPAAAGVLLAVPNRHTLLVVPVAGPDAIESVGPLFEALTRALSGPQPGGVVSSAVYWDDGSGVELVGWFGEEGRPALAPTESLAAALGVEESAEG